MSATSKYPTTSSKPNTFHNHRNPASTYPTFFSKSCALHNHIYPASTYLTAIANHTPSIPISTLPLQIHQPLPNCTPYKFTLTLPLSRMTMCEMYLKGLCSLVICMSRILLAQNKGQYQNSMLKVHFIGAKSSISLLAGIPSLEIRNKQYPLIY